jgi:WD40 repeat protein
MQAAPTEWRAELHNLAGSLAMSRSPLLLTHASAGPCLTWRRGGYVVIVPSDLWARLPVEERLLILRHELAHLLRGDLWTGLLSRLVAAVHWFNPFAWLAVRRLEECAEWACDEAACGGDSMTATIYSKLLITLRLNHSSVGYGTAMADGRTVVQRVRRLLDGEGRESMVRVVAIAAAILTAFISLRIDIRLRADDGPSAAATQNASPTGVLKIDSEGLRDIAVYGPDSHPLPGKLRPEGLIAIIGDEREGLSGGVRHMTVSLDGQRVYVVTTSGGVDVFDAQTRVLQEHLRCPNRSAVHCVISPDSKRMAVSATDGSLHVFDVSVTPGELVKSLMPFGPAEKKFWPRLIPCEDSSRFSIHSIFETWTQVYEWSAGEPRLIFEDKDTVPQSASLSPNGRFLAVHGDQSDVVIWDLDANPARPIVRHPVSGVANGILGFRDDRTLCLAVNRRESKFDLQLLTFDQDAFQVHDQAADGISFSSSRGPLFFDGGKRALAFATSGDVHGPSLIDCSGSKWVVQQRLWSFPGPRFGGAAISPDGNFLYVAVDQVLRRWSRAQDAWPALPDENGPTDVTDVNALAFLSDGRSLLFDSGGTLRHFQILPGTPPKELGRVPWSSTEGAFRIVSNPVAAEAVVVGTGRNGSISVVRPSSDGLKVSARVDFGEDYQHAPWAAAYTPDGKRIVVGFHDGVIRVYENRDDGLRLLREIANVADGLISAVGCSPTGSSIAFGNQKGEVGLYDLVSPDAIAIKLTPHPQIVHDVIFTPDGGSLLSAFTQGDEGGVNVQGLHLNSLALSRLPGFVDEDGTSIGFGGVTSLQFAAEGRFLLTASGWNSRAGSKVALWAMPEKRLVQVWDFAGRVDAAISPDGRLTAVLRNDGTIAILASPERLFADRNER